MTLTLMLLVLLLEVLLVRVLPILPLLCISRLSVVRWLVGHVELGIALLLVPLSTLLFDQLASIGTLGHCHVLKVALPFGIVFPVVPLVRFIS